MSLWFQEAPPVGRVAELGSLGRCIRASPHVHSQRNDSSRKPDVIVSCSHMGIGRPIISIRQPDATSVLAWCVRHRSSRSPLILGSPVEARPQTRTHQVCQRNGSGGLWLHRDRRGDASRSTHRRPLARLPLSTLPKLPREHGREACYTEQIARGLTMRCSEPGHHLAVSRGTSCGPGR